MCLHASEVSKVTEKSRLSHGLSRSSAVWLCRFVVVWYFLAGFASQTSPDGPLLQITTFGP